ncbi:hypothetical protein L1857_08515 [Amycolatopsis thermalba]|uniref:VWFA domain-containing protein n=1 Tax=Amycolatopsis thermalba TaxID=944492 RepID=A0ABY4NS35_9PSEU|nr:MULTISPECIES: hypothetical protein [Amycolatopsis]UQS22856.1 hypothetical protein L1857_08515 [Amycolatopsis thermalba]
MSRYTTLHASALLSSRVLGTPTPSKQPRPGNVEYALGKPGRPAEVPTLLITSFDNSGSVTSPGGTDPLSNRFAEVERAFSVVARKGSSRELGAVIHFDTPSSGEIPPTPITRSGLVRLRRGLRPPLDGAGTSELGPSLNRAIELAELHPGHEVTLVVFSDFQLLDANPAQVLSDLAAFPGQVHAVVLGAYLPAGVLDERITVTTIKQNAYPGSVARALFSSLVAHRPGSQVADDP